MQTYIVSPTTSPNHPDAREIVSHSPAGAADVAYNLRMPCDADPVAGTYTYHVHAPDGTCTEIDTEDPDLEAAISIGGNDLTGCPDFFTEAFPG